MSRYIFTFAKKLDRVAAHDIQEALAQMRKRNPDVNIEDVFVVGKSKNPDYTPRTEKVKSPWEMCPLCQKMHKKNSKQWNKCVKKLGGI